MIPSDDPQLCHERLGETFAEALSSYDTNRRIEVLTGEFLKGFELRGRPALEVGCGLGYFSQVLAQLGADLTVCDIGPKLVEGTARAVGCKGQVADATRLTDTFARESFDLVLSSECIEHTPDPGRAVDEMCAVVRPGGRLVLSTPNLLWWPVVALASKLKVRPFDGYENFSTFGSLTRRIEGHGLIVRRSVGLHLFPFQFGLHGLSRWADEHLQVLKPLMINICILAEKPAA